jgi:transcription antitermination factor NusG
MGEACLQTVDDIAGFQPSKTSTTNWYTLKVRTGAETKAAEALQYRGFAPYCPLQFERRQYSDRMKVVKAAAFPGYVFCQFDVQHKLPIISSPGVEYIVGFAEGPAAVPEKEIEDVRRMIDAGALAVPCVARGAKVRVTHGPLQGVEGVLVRDTNGDRLVVSIELLSRGASLHINQDSIAELGTN